MIVFPLPGFVQPSSERTLNPVRRDNSFAEKQESHPARLLVVLSDSDLSACRDCRNHARTRLRA
jgi:hypothetical protein